jgi:hypothetical protein
MHPNKLKNIYKLSPEERYGYFIRQVADSNEVWLIKDGDKFVTLGDKNEQITIPVFPEKEFADLLLTDDWANCSVELLDLNKFMDWLDQLQQDKVKIAGFPKDDFNAIVVEPEEMKNHLLYELQQYE